ncbi:hypothetical protein VE00_04952 [Neofusicoccum parvum]|nr:hypothetical protein VE00_04952 [Neofusicoccum parvum]
MASSPVPQNLIQLSPDHPNFQREWQREPRRRLKDVSSHGNSWGFTIVRTTYTGDFQTALDTLRRYVELECYADLRYTSTPDAPLDPEPNRELFRRFHTDVIADAATLDGASMDDVRARFRAWAAQQGGASETTTNPRFRACIVVDAEVLQALLLAPPPPALDDASADVPLDAIWVKVVDAAPAAAEMAPPYAGWLRVSVLELARFWAAFIYQEMHELYEMDEDEEVPVYGG